MFSNSDDDVPLGIGAGDLSLISIMSIKSSMCGWIILLNVDVVTEVNGIESIASCTFSNMDSKLIFLDLL